ncbi:MAG: isoprenylcysteine carboxylmethyltransferase family protein [Chloroflexota bacterium]
MADARPAIFALVSLLLAYISHASLLRPKSHGFFRFFVWEAILGLVLINAPIWFVNPFSWHQVISWILLVGSLAPLAFGLRALRTHGRHSAAARQEPELLAFERTSRLVREGIFRYIRHPLYSSLLLLAWGAFFKAPSAIGGALAGVATAGLMRTAIMDEAECLQVFGQEYREYMTHTRRFIPGVF